MFFYDENDNSIKKISNCKLKKNVLNPQKKVYLKIYVYLVMMDIIQNIMI